MAHREHGELQRPRKALDEDVTHGAALAEGLAEVEPRRVLEPDEELHEHRPIQPQLGADLGDLLFLDGALLRARLVDEDLRDVAGTRRMSTKIISEAPKSVGMKSRSRRAT
jgi:hypothetical protein